MDHFLLIWFSLSIFRGVMFTQKYRTFYKNGLFPWIHELWSMASLHSCLSQISAVNDLFLLVSVWQSCKVNRVCSVSCQTGTGSRCIRQTGCSSACDRWSLLNGNHTTITRWILLAGVSVFTCLIRRGMTYRAWSWHVTPASCSATLPLTSKPLGVKSCLTWWGLHKKANERGQIGGRGGLKFSDYSRQKNTHK